MLKNKIVRAFNILLMGVDDILKATPKKTFFHLFFLCSFIIIFFLGIALLCNAYRTDTNWLTTYQDCCFKYFKGLFNGEIGWSFRERRPMTIMSALMLVLVGLISKNIFSIRKPITKDSKLWFLLYIGFIYLALDDFIGIHEAIDHQICNIFGWDKHGPADKIDDLIIALYGVCGVGILLRYWRESLLFRHAWCYFSLAALGTILTVIFDFMGGEGELMLKWFPENERFALDILDLAEEFSKIFAEICFVTAFLKVRVTVYTLYKKLT